MATGKLAENHPKNNGNKSTARRDFGRRLPPAGAGSRLLNASIHGWAGISAEGSLPLRGITAF